MKHNRTIATSKVQISTGLTEFEFIIATELFYEGLKIVTKLLINSVMVK